MVSSAELFLRVITLWFLVLSDIFKDGMGPFNDTFAALCKRNFKIKMFFKPGSDGVVDTLCVLLGDYCEKNRRKIGNKGILIILYLCMWSSYL